MRSSAHELLADPHEAPGIGLSQTLARLSLDWGWESLKVFSNLGPRSEIQPLLAKPTCVQTFSARSRWFACEAGRILLSPANTNSGPATDARISCDFSLLSTCGPDLSFLILGPDLNFLTFSHFLDVQPRLSNYWLGLSQDISHYSGSHPDIPTFQPFSHDSAIPNVDCTNPLFSMLIVLFGVCQVRLVIQQVIIQNGPANLGFLFDISTGY